MGDTTAGNWQHSELILERRHDSGLYGVIWEARQQRLGRRVAVKIIKPEMAGVANAVDHARSLARVNHENVVTVFHVDRIVDPESPESGDVDCVVMEWLDGERLGDRLNEERFAFLEAKDICRALLDGLRAIHAVGIPHRDLHAGNVLLTPDGPKIIDIAYPDFESVARRSASYSDVPLLGDVEAASYLVLRILMHSDLRRTSILPHESALRSAASLDAVWDAICRIEAENNKPIERQMGWGLTERLPRIDFDNYELCGEAIKILLEASIDVSGRVAHMRYLGGEEIGTNSVQFIEQGNPRSVALWTDALEELVDNGLLELLSSSGGSSIYRVTTPGYDLADEAREALQTG